MGTKQWLKALIVCCCLLPALAPAGHGGTGGSFDSNDDLTLHVYFAYEEDEANFSQESSTWQQYFIGAAKAYYDALEGKSKISKIYLYNNLPEGKAKADVWIDSSTAFGASAARGTFGSRNGRVTILGGVLTRGGLGHRTLVHELGHYIYDLNDCYGGQIDSAPPEWLEPAERPAPGMNYRTYMWSDAWIRHRVAALSGTKVFYNKGGHGGTSMMDRNGPEFAVDSTQVGPQTHSFALPKYKYRNHWLAVTLTRSADKKARDYTVRTEGWKKLEEPWFSDWTSEWDLIADYHGWTMPTSTSTDTLAAADYPEFFIVGSAAIAVCLDHSGSMSSDNRMALAKSGANVVINNLRGKTTDQDGHFSGIVGFDSSAAVDQPIIEIVDTSSRSTLRGAVNGMVADGGTSIGAALSVCQTALLAHADMDKIIILLSDGKSGDNALAPVPSLAANGITVYTIAIGSGADTATLGKIASMTGGEMRSSTSAGDTVRFFEDLFAKLTGAGAAGSSSVYLPAQETYTEDVPVESGAERAVFSMSSDQAQVEFRLETPSGTTIDESVADPSISYREVGDHHLFEIRDPEAGSWRLIVENVMTGSDLGPFSKIESPALEISSALPPAVSTMSVAQSGTITDLKVAVDILHTYKGDLTVTLKSPAGTEVILHNRAGSSGDDIQGTFGVDLTPAESLTVLNGEDVQGNWTLTVEDSRSGDTGTLENWALSNGGNPAGANVTMTRTINSPSILVDGTISDTDVVYPEPIIIKAGVQADGLPVANAHVYAQVSAPDGSSFRLDLFDDGDTGRGDNQASDGVYAASYDGYSENGTYEITVHCINDGGTSAEFGDGDETGAAPPTFDIQPFERVFGVQANVTGVPEHLSRFFTVGTLAGKYDPAKVGKDSVKIKGKFSMPVIEDFDGTAMSPSLRIGGFSRDYPGSGWERVGRKHRYVYKSDGDTGQIDYFVGGGSRGKYSFKSKKTSLAGAFTNPDSVQVNLRVGDLDDTAYVRVNEKNTSYKYGSRAASLEFFINTLSVKLKGKPNRDSVLFTGRVTGPFAFDPNLHGFNLSVGPLDVVIPAGGWTSVKGTKLVYSSTTPSGQKVKVQYNTEKGLLSLKASKADMHLLSGVETAGIALELDGIGGARWGYQVTLAADETGMKKRF